MSHDVTVTVRRGRHVVAGPVARPVRTTPDSVAGVVYGGRVYPLRAGDWIDLNDEPYAKEDCGFLPNGEEITYLASSGIEGRSAVPGDLNWYIETNSYGHYLVFDGDGRICEAVLDALEQAGIGIRRCGQSYRPADNGITYDWFVRLDFPDDREACLKAVRDALDVKIASDGTPSRADALPNLDAIRAIFDEVAAEAIAERDRLRHMLDEKEADLAASGDRERQAAQALKRARADIRFLETTCADLQQQLHSAHASGMQAREQEAAADEAKKLRAERDQARGEANDLLDQATALENEKAALSKRLDDTKKELEETRDRNDDLTRKLCRLQEQSHHLSARHRRNGATRIKQIMSGAFRRLMIDEDAYETMAESFPDLTDLVHVLKVLDTNDPELPLKRVHGHPGMKEVKRHIRTGDPAASDMGRVYIREHLTSRRLVVFVHRKEDKAEQQRFIELCANRPLEDLGGFDTIPA